MTAWQACGGIVAKNIGGMDRSINRSSMAASAA